MSDARKIANCSLRASLIFLWGRTGAVFRTKRSLIRAPVEAQFVVTDLEQVTFTPCLLVKPRKWWTDDRPGQTVSGLVSMLCLMCLVQGTLSLDLTTWTKLYHTHSLKFQKRSHRKTGYAISNELPYLSNTQFHKCKLDGVIAT